jgi:hypothetical protein
MQPVSRHNDVEGEVLRHETNHVPASRTAAGEGGVMDSTLGKPTPKKDYKPSTKLMAAVLAGSLGSYFCLLILAHFGVISGSIVESIRDYVVLLAR